MVRVVTGLWDPHKEFVRGGGDAQAVEEQTLLGASV